MHRCSSLTGGKSRNFDFTGESEKSDGSCEKLPDFLFFREIEILCELGSFFYSTEDMYSHTSNLWSTDEISY